MEIGRRPFGGLRHLKIYSINESLFKVEIGRRPFGGLRHVCVLIAFVETQLGGNRPSTLRGIETPLGKIGRRSFAS